MPEEKTPTPELNLLATDELENQPQGKVLRWALTWGKRIIVITELIVILAFLSRFWLDTRVADLSEQIKQKKDIILASAGEEQKYRLLVDRVDNAQKIEGSPRFVQIYDQARQLIPRNIRVDQLTVKDSTVSFTGVGGEVSLSDLVKAFMGSASFKEINVTRLSKRSSVEGVNFAFKATYGP